MGPDEDATVDVVQARDHKVRPSSRSSTEAIAASVCVGAPVYPAIGSRAHTLLPSSVGLTSHARLT
jgi:hypothetical protein